MPGSVKARDDVSRAGNVRRGVLVLMTAVCSKTTIGKAADLLSGPGGLAGFLRRRQLGARLGGPSLPLDIGYAETVPAGIHLIGTRTGTSLTASWSGRTAACSPPMALPLPDRASASSAPSSRPPGPPGYMSATRTTAPASVRSRPSGHLGLRHRQHLETTARRPCGTNHVVARALGMLAS
jgi:hypothetical protein